MPEDKVFDVSKPNRVTPSATSRPVIVGHHPIMNDPMVTGTTATASTAPAELPADPTSTPIHVSMDDAPAENVQTSQPEIPSFAPIEDKAGEPAAQAISAESQHEVEPTFVPQPEKSTPDPVAEFHPDEHQTEEPHQETNHANAEVNHEYTPINTLIGHDGDIANNADPQQYNAGSTIPPDSGGHWQDVQPLAMPHGAGPKRRWLKVFAWLLGFALIAATTIFLLIDLGIVQSDIKLPFHIFNKQKTSMSDTAVTPPPTPPVTQPPATNSVPLGFTLFKIDDTTISFAYPDEWGKPTTTKEEGFSERGTGKQSDGTYAYLIDFAKNKDVQLAFTSSKLLPKKRDAQYFDYMQWCKGTNDDKYYKQTLHFTTESGVDAPSTVVCDEGPLENITKLNDSTITQAKAESTKGLVLGDLFTKNLDNEEFVAVHVKDATMKNTDKIEEILETVKTSN
jgi:hypothetical protein